MMKMETTRIYSQNNQRILYFIETFKET